ncbi:MAG: glycoside hydrolase family 95 protein [Chitinophagaceae bacterium]|nr:glycoside hydrolase family 95 protein [Chitinophagaceae bacterium]
MTLFRKVVFIVGFMIWGGAYAQQNGTLQKIIERNFDPATLLWYRQAAGTWDDALPVGNGRLGAMVFGRTGEEIIQFNEDTYWSGGPYSTVVKGGHTKLKEIQELVFNEQFFEAQKRFGRYLMGYPVEQQKYQALGNIHLFFPEEKEVSNYHRWLDLETAVTTVQYSINGVQYKREVFASEPDQAIVIRITADKPGAVSFKANLRGERNQQHSNYATDYFRMDGEGNDRLVLTGKSADYMGIKGALKYEVKLKAAIENGTVSVDDENMVIQNADAVTLYLVAATNFVNYKDVSADAHSRVSKYLDALQGKGYDQLKQRHIQDYRKLFGRVTLQLPVTDLSYEPTDVRIKNIRYQPDPALAALGYQFGRYTLIASSRPGTQPANLQGIWNKDMNPWWDSKYTTNINIQMNYWAVESANLSECAEPLIKMVEELMDEGAAVAREHYGAKGWVFHQNTDLWRVAAPMDGSTWGTFTVGGAWLTNHLWEHYLYNPDQQFLKRAYPVLKGSVDFFMDFLVRHPTKGWLVTNPSNSPENFPDRPGNGKYFDEVTASFRPATNVCAGATIDMQILHDLFDYYIKAANLLKLDADYIEKVQQAKSQLPPPLVGKDGALQEWLDDWGQTEIRHRHLSHLYGLYPGNVLSFQKTPEVMPAVRAALEQRGDSSYGNAPWSMAWKIPLWARMGDGERANKILKLYLARHASPQFFTKGPMQIDGTMGLAAGVTEMLVQSNEGYVELLPAVPAEWNAGKADGIKVRGGFEINMTWKDRKPVQLNIHSSSGMIFRLKKAGAALTLRDSRGKLIKPRSGENNMIEFPTRAGENYLVQFK